MFVFHVYLSILKLMSELALNLAESMYYNEFAKLTVIPNIIVVNSIEFFDNVYN
jgi:hypothetical protein